MNVKTRKDSRAMRHTRVRAKISGSAVCPRLSIMISNRHMYVQLIDDAAAVTLASAQSLTEGNPTVATAQGVGRQLGEKAKAKGLTRFVVDRGGYRFHGRVKAIVDGVLEMGLTNLKEAK
ncbi:MAG TPA: 50S ribosomal protein L18 [Verrucomicrobia bacterium]|nr:50S ribosomal protein L18 [Verrucomicrobiota bacterium]